MRWRCRPGPWTIRLSLWANTFSSGTHSPGAAAVCKITVAHYAAGEITVDSTGDIPAAAAGVQAARLITYKTQPGLLPPPALFAGDGPVDLYIDVWERLITCVEDDSIREVALNGAHTAARAKVVWQVRAIPAPQQQVGKNVRQAGSITADQLSQQFQPINRGLLRARVQPGAASTDPCAVSPISAYRGLENQLYRVEIHDGAQPGCAATFKWSRENGSAVFPMSAAAISGAGTLTVPLASLGRDDRFGLAEGDWVELQDDALALSSAAAIAPAPALLQVEAINRAMMQVTLAGPHPARPSARRQGFTRPSAVGTSRSAIPPPAVSP